MRFVVLGPGAVGGVIGGRLAQYGHDVVLVARAGGEHLKALQDKGLRLDDPDGSVTLRVPAFGSPAEVDWRDGDVAILATKTQDAGPLLETLAAAAGPDVPVVCATNGVESERMAARRFAHVHPLCVMLPATHLEPGVVAAWSAPTSGILDLGRYPSGADDVSEAVAAALRASHFDSVADPQVMRQKYAKLLMNLANAIEAACGSDARGSDLHLRARAEGEAVLAAAEIDVATMEEDLARRGDIVRLRPVNGERRAGGSSWQSLRRGTGSIEADYLNGEIALLGRIHGVPTPVNAMLQRVANELARAGTPPGSMTPPDLEALLTG